MSDLCIFAMVAIPFILGWLAGRHSVRGHVQAVSSITAKYLQLAEENRKKYRDAQATIRKGTRIVEHRPPSPGWIEHMQEKATKLKEKQKKFFV